MDSFQAEYDFPHFPPPDAARPPPPAPHVIPPSPHTVPPPPHTIPPPSPQHFVPPPPLPPHTIPPPAPAPPGNHTTIIVVVFVSCGGVFFLAFIMAALWCFLKKKKKMVPKAENVHINEHRKVMETMVQGPHGTETVMLSVEDDIHIEEDIRKSEIENFRKGLHLNSDDSFVASLEDAKEQSSSSAHHNHGHKP